MNSFTCIYPGHIQSEYIVLEIYPHCLENPLVKEAWEILSNMFNSDKCTLQPWLYDYLNIVSHLLQHVDIVSHLLQHIYIVSHLLQHVQQHVYPLYHHGCVIRHYDV